MRLTGDNMIKTSAMIIEGLNQYKSPADRLSRLVKTNQYYPIVRGLYETDPTTPPYLLAGSIYGPSYISFEYALSYYGLIPEKVIAVTSATFEKKKKKRYETPFGVFLYQDVPTEAFPLAIRMIREGEYYYRIASPEKALCDKLYTLAPLPNQKSLWQLLIEDLRIDEEQLANMDVNLVEYLSKSYYSTNIKKFAAVLRR